jgi:hypothetical protein
LTLGCEECPPCYDCEQIDATTAECVPRDCNDGNPNTSDSCNVNTDQCVHVELPSPYTPFRPRR